MNPADTSVPHAAEPASTEEKHVDIGLIELVGLGLLAMMVLLFLIAVVMLFFMDPLGGQYEKIVR